MRTPNEAGERPRTKERACRSCSAPLPAGSRSYRQFCSSRCRSRAWDAANRRDEETPNPLYGRSGPRKHYHCAPWRILVGHRDNEPWFGKACPPECPGLGPGETFAPMELVYARSPIRTIHTKGAA